MSFKLSINKILITLTVILLAAAAIIYTSGAVSAKKALEAQQAKDAKIADTISSAVDICYSVYGRVNMPEEEIAKLKVYENNMANESEPRIKAYIAYSMAEYAADRIVAVKLADYTDENAEIPADISDGLSDLVNTQNNLSSVLEIS